MGQLVLNRVKEDGQVTHYEDSATKEQVSIQAGLSPWTWNVSTESALLKKHSKAIVNEYVSQGIDQHKFNGGFSEATSVLTIKFKG